MATTDDSVTQLSLGEIDQVVAGMHHDPHSILGAHPVSGGIAVRALLPLAGIPDYRLAVTYPGDEGAGSDSPAAGILIDDPYRHLPTLGEMDLHLIGEGRHEELWRGLGAQLREYSGGPPAPAAPGRAAGGGPPVA